MSQSIVVKVPIKCKCGHESWFTVLRDQVKMVVSMARKVQCLACEVKKVGT